MTSWYDKITSDPDDFSLIPAACEFFEKECKVAVREIDMAEWRGRRVEEMQKQFPGIVGHRYQQLQEIEAIMEYLEIRQTGIRGARRRHYLEHYNRQLTPTTAEKYVEADELVLEMALLCNQVARVRNQFVALSKQHEYLHFQLGHLSKLIAAGVNDALL